MAAPPSIAAKPIELQIAAFLQNFSSWNKTAQGCLAGFRWAAVVFWSRMVISSHALGGRGNPRSLFLVAFALLGLGGVALGLLLLGRDLHGADVGLGLGFERSELFLRDRRVGHDDEVRGVGHELDSRRDRQRADRDAVVDVRELAEVDLDLVD